MTRALLLVSLLPAMAAAPSDDWPQFLGPTRNGVYTGALANAPAQIWKRDVGQGFSAPVIAKGRLILFHRISDREIVEALDATTGKTTWKFDYPTRYRDDFGFDEGPRAAPAVEGDRIYTFGAEGVLHALEFATGKKIWSVDTASKFGVRKGFFGAACSPLIEGDKVLVNVGGASGAGIVAFDVNSGAVAWTATNDEASYSAPVAATIEGARHALFFTRAGLVDLDPANGKVRFQFPWRSRMNASVNAATPVVIGNLVYVSASYGTGAALLDLTGGKPKKLWSSDDAISNHYSTSVYRDGYLYGYHGRQEEGQSLRAVELKSGKVAWNVDGFGAGTITLASDRLILVRENGELVQAAASPKKFQPGPATKLLPGPVRSYPVLAGGMICVRNERTLACFR